jgi:hypothetical protein
MLVIVIECKNETRKRVVMDERGVRWIAGSETGMSGNRSTDTLLPL